jgi:catalase
VRERGALFADHFSQARQFYLSQTAVEQTHIADAFTFELSKVETPAIRERLVANLCNVDQELAQKIADGIGMALPAPSEPARAVVDLPQSQRPLSMLKNPPPSFEGRKVGALVTDGTDADILAALKKAVEAEGRAARAGRAEDRWHRGQRWHADAGASGRRGRSVGAL